MKQNKSLRMYIIFSIKTSISIQCKSKKKYDAYYCYLDEMLKLIEDIKECYFHLPYPLSLKMKNVILKFQNFDTSIVSSIVFYFKSI